MSFIHQEVFRVRHYECDGYGHVNNAVYLRYLQETALRASEAAGFPIQRLAEQGLGWWSNRTDIEYITPLYFRDAFEVICKVTGQSDSELWQEFELRKNNSSEVAARAGMNSFLIKRGAGETRKQVSLPADTLPAFFRENFPEDNAGLPSVPDAPPAPPGVFRIEQTVGWQDVNAIQWVDPAMLLAYVEDCGRQVVAAYGWAMERMLKERFAILLRRNQIEYLQPACLGDRLEILTWASNMRRATATRHYLIRRLPGGEILGRVNALGVWVNLDSGLPMRIPPGLLQDFAPNIVS